MAVYKEEKTGTWRVIYRYTDWTGERKQTQKRGFKTKRDAQAWEREQQNKATSNLDMTFASFVEQYTADMKTRLKENTWATKEHIIRSKLLPYFGKLKMCNITAQQIITWQNEMLNYKDDKGKPYSPVYLKTIHNQLSAIFNHAVRYYNLKENPCKKAGSMGKKKNREMLFWTKDEYLKFADVMMDKPLSYYAFEMLYWTGIREGELLALTSADFNFEKEYVTINKSFQHLNGRDIITSPKTEKSNRTIKLPNFLCEEIQDYLKMMGYQSPEKLDEWLFINHMGRQFTRQGVNYIIKKYGAMARESSPDLIPDSLSPHKMRHTAAMELVDSGVDMIYIRDLLGHVSVKTTEIYAKTDAKLKREEAVLQSLIMQRSMYEKRAVSREIVPHEDAKRDSDDDLKSWLKSFNKH